MPGGDLHRAVELHELLGVGVDPDEVGDVRRHLLRPGHLPRRIADRVETAVHEHARDQRTGHEAADAHEPGCTRSPRPAVLARMAARGVPVRLRGMDDVLGYEGKHVVVTGAASGMGEQVARICHELGANVTALDLKPVSTPVKTSITLDLLDEASIDGVVAQIDGPVDSVFSCAGLPGPPFTDLETATVNFIGARHLIDESAPRDPRAGRGRVHRVGRGRRLAAGAGDVRAAARHRDVRRRGRLVRGEPRRRRSRSAATACRRSS